MSQSETKIVRGASAARGRAFFKGMSKLNLYYMNPSSPKPPDADEQRRDELCLQLAENLNDLGASEFSRETRAGESRFIIHVVRA